MIGRGSRSIVFKFVADISKANRDIERLSKKLDVARGKAAAIRTTGIGGGKDWAEDFAKSRPAGWSKSIAWAGAGRMPGVDRNAAFLAARKAEMSLEGVAEGGASLLSSFANLIPILGKVAVALGVLYKTLERAFHYGNIMEQSKIVLKSIYGSEKRAVGVLGGMREFSRKTQFAPEEVVGATTMLAKYNVDPFSKGQYGMKGGANPMMLMAGLASMPGMGGVPIGLDRAINAAIAGRDIRPLKALGPEVLAAYETARKAGTSGSQEYVNAMMTELAKIPKILNLANEQMNTMKTMWSTITGYAEEFWMDFSGAEKETGVVTFWSQFKDILMDIRDAGERFVVYIGPYVTELGTAFASVFKFIWDILKEIWNLLGPVITPVFKILIQVARIFFEVMKGIFNTVVQLGRLLVNIIKLPFQIISAIFGASLKVENLINMLSEFVTGLQITFMFLNIFITGIVDSIEKAITRMIQNFGLIFEELGYKFDEFWKKYGKYLEFGMKTASPFGGLMDNPLFSQGANVIKGNVKSFYEENKEDIWGRAEFNIPGSQWASGMADWAKRSKAEREARGITVNNNDNRTIIYNETKKIDMDNVINQTGKSFKNPFAR